MIDHMSLNVKSLPVAKQFYDAVLAPLGFTTFMATDEFVMYTHEDGSLIGLHEGAALPTHFAFGARSKDEVEAFYKVGLSNGGTDNGAPGIREVYAPNYYAAFVIDPDGNNVEAVHHLKG